jgi:hypothetical protein
VERVGRTWVLRTDTKGTGAQMVPLESITERRVNVEPVFVPAKPAVPAEPAPTPKAPHRFRIVDVMTRQTLVDDADAREAVEALRGVRSVVDVGISVWHEDRRRWVPLTFAERRLLFDLAQRPPAEGVSR